MTPTERLNAAIARAEAATEGPWRDAGIVRDVLDLHAPGWHPDTGHYCKDCGMPLTEDTPNCPTVGAITARLGDA